MSIYQLFNELNYRLLTIQNTYTAAEPFPEPTYYELFRSIERGLGNFSAKEVVAIAESYLDRIDALIGSFQKQLQEGGVDVFELSPLVVVDQMPIQQIDQDGDTFKELNYLEELNYYKLRLSVIVEANRNESSKRILLPNSFQVKAVKEHVPDPVQVSTLANLFYILQRKGNIAPLDALPLAKLIMPIFGISVQTFRTAYGSAEHNHKRNHDLQEVKAYLQEILHFIKDLESKK